MVTMSTGTLPVHRYPRCRFDQGPKGPLRVNRASSSRHKGSVRHSRRRGIFLRTILALLSGLSLSGSPNSSQRMTPFGESQLGPSGNTETPLRPSQYRYKVATLVVRSTTYREPITAYGTLRPKNTLRINTEIAGRILSVNSKLKMGMFIAKGELLFEIDSSSARTAVKLAEAEIERVKAQIAGSEVQLSNHQERMKNRQKQLEIKRKQWQTEMGLLENGGGASAYSVDQYLAKFLEEKDRFLALANEENPLQLQIDKKKAQLEVALEKFKIVQLRLQQSKVFCPFDARVVEVQAHVSESFTPGASLAILAPLDMEISVSLPPQDLQWTALRNFSHEFTDSSLVEVDVKPNGQAMGPTYRGVVTHFVCIDPNTRQARFIIKVQNSSTSPLRDRRFMEVSIPTEPVLNAILIPPSALSYQDYVFVFKPEPDRPPYGSLVRIKVRVLRRVNDVLLIEGLPSGVEIVLNPPGIAMDGLKVIRLHRENKAQQLAARTQFVRAFPADTKPQ